MHQKVFESISEHLQQILCLHIWTSKTCQFLKRRAPGMILGMNMGSEGPELVDFLVDPKMF